GLCYWREEFGTGNYGVISGMQDLDGSGALELAADGDNIPNNGIALATYPGFAEDEDGNLYIVFSSMVETHDNGDQNFRHIHIINSEDGGNTWLDVPVDLTPDLDYDGFECTFPSISHQVVDGKVHLIYQRDTEPGLHVAGDTDPADDNDIVYYCITTDLVVEPTVYEQFMEAGIVAYPNPANNQFSVNILDASGVKVDVINALGEVVLTQMTNTDNCRFDVSQLAAGVYSVSAVVDGKLRTTKLVVE
ncbi:MAG: T9SS type A sorting domain-containing protein, partial [Flavobacteriales bacterium]|nr:T9SS type A sorting domain-containing protein [Flavobacteriales bacterium]